MLNYLLQKRSPSLCFVVPGIMTGRPPLVRNLRQLLLLPLLPEIGEGVTQIHGVGSIRLPLVQGSLVLLSLLAAEPHRRPTAGFSQIGVMSLPSSNWKLSVPPLVVLEGWGAEPWVMEVLRSWYVISFHSVPPLSGSPIALESYSPQSIKGKALEEIQSLPQGCGQACVSFSRVLQSHVCGHQGVQRVETYHRCLHSEPVSCEDAVSDGDCPVSSPLGAEERLDGLHRPEGRLPSGADSSIESQVPQVHSRREGLAVQGLLLRSVHSAAGAGHGSCVRFPPPVRCSDASLSGRLADSSFVSGGSLLGKGQSPEFVRT